MKKFILSPYVDGFTPKDRPKIVKFLLGPYVDGPVSKSKSMDALVSKSGQVQLRTSSHGTDEGIKILKFVQEAKNKKPMKGKLFTKAPKQW